eukprot:jgi/Antlo1/872/1984
MNRWSLLLALCIESSVRSSLSNVSEKHESVSAEVHSPHVHLSRDCYGMNRNPHSAGYQVVCAEDSFSTNYPETSYALNKGLGASNGTHQLMVPESNCADENRAYYSELSNEVPGNIQTGDCEPVIQGGGAVDSGLPSKAFMQDVGGVVTHDIAADHCTATFYGDNLVLDNPDISIENLQNADAENPLIAPVPSGGTLKGWCGILELFGCRDGCCGEKCCEVLTCKDGCCDTFACNDLNWDVIIPDEIENPVTTILN